jgi:hypothetical protein
MNDGFLEWRHNQNEQMSHRERKMYENDLLIQKELKMSYKENKK